MWQHIELERLYLAAEGNRLLESETDHFVYCELCQKLLIFFEKQIRKLSAPDLKAA
jgi:hypothetical protein